MTVLRWNKRSMVLWVFQMSSESEGLCPVENSEGSGHLTSPSVAFTDVESIRLRDNLWGRTDGRDKRLYLFHYFLSPHFPRSPSCDPEIDRSASRWRMSQFRKCIWRTKDLLEWPWVKCVCTAATSKAKQRMEVALCFLSQAKSQYKLITLYKTTNHPLTQKLSCSAAVWHIQCISMPSPRPTAGALPPLEH